MRIAICANEIQKNEVLEKGIGESVEIVWFNEQQEKITNVDACIDLLFDERENAENIFIKDIPVLANTVITTASQLPENYVRINAWNGFLKRDIVEVTAPNIQLKEKAETILNALGWKFIWCIDEPGMIAARIIAMIINEAYFAFEQQVSTKEEIDIAMKLGTNYPYGPFEWSKKIGLDKIYALLNRLSQNDSRYEVCELLKKEAESTRVRRNETS